MPSNRFQQILTQARAQLNPEEQRRMAEALSQHAFAPSGPQEQRVEFVDPREERMGPATSDFTQRLRALRKDHLAEGGRFLNKDQIDELLADQQGSISERD
jgi:hypothetical protein